MEPVLVIAVALVGFASGLRAFTGVAVLAWGAYLGCLDLAQTPFAFMSSAITVGVFSILAAGEFVGDLLPSTPSRTAAFGLIGRIITGSFCAACLLAAMGSNIAIAVLGGVFGVIGAFAGYHARVRLVRALAVKDAWIAIPEDLVAVGISILAVCLTAR